MNDIDTMPLDELNVEVAKALGQPLHQEKILPNGDEAWVWVCPDYSGNIKDAWECVEAMENKDVWFEASSLIPNSDAIYYEIKFSGANLPEGYAIGSGGTMAEAICRAYLKAVNPVDRENA